MTRDTSLFVFLCLLYSLMRIRTDDYGINESISDSSPSTIGWSVTSTINCAGQGSQITEIEKQYLGLIGSNGIATRTYTNLPPHYSASIRIDFLLLDNWNNDLFNIYFDNIMITQKLNTESNNPNEYCNNNNYNDLFYRGYWQRTHSSTSLQVKVELQAVDPNPQKYIAFRSVQIAVDSCHYSCLTCYNSNFNGCLTCPFGTTDGDDRCYCPANQYAEAWGCVSTCKSGYAPNLVNKFCEISCTAPQIAYKKYCITPDPAVKNEQYYLSYGLFSQNYTAIEIFGLGWKIINMGQVGVYTDCGTNRYFGGYAIVSTDTIMQIQFSNLPKHYNVKIKFIAVLVDWQNGNNVYLQLDGKTIETISKPSSGGSSICGMMGRLDYTLTYNNPAYTHSDGNMIITFTNNYGGTELQFGFGIRQFEVYLDKCPQYCSQCDTNGCIICDPGYLLYSKICVQVCPAQYYPISNIAKPKCDPCYNNCATCSIGNGANECDSCSSSMFLKEGSCVTDCGDNYYADSNNICQPCDKTCLRCITFASNTCTKCQTPLYLNKVDKRCVENVSCPDGTYPEVSDRTCAVCDGTCLTCNGPTATDCLSCTNYLDVNSCTSNCGIGKYANDLKKTCDKCDPNCYACSKVATNCIQCADPNFLDNSKCQPNCPISKYGNVTDRTCKTCPLNCVSCIGGTGQDCTACSNGYFLTKIDLIHNSGTCGLSCSNGYWQDTVYNQCKICYSNCLTCDPPGNQNSCKTCQPNYYLTIERSCDQQCPDRYYKDTTKQVCLPCHNTCLQCSQSGDTFCTKCDSGRYLYLLTATEGSCWINCPDTKYNDGVTSTCLSCYANCKTCSGSLSNQCAACMPGKYFYKNECISSCPDGTYPNNQALKCEDCNLTCTTCNGPLDGNCLTCGGTRYLKGTQCISNCPDGQYNDLPSNKCLPCEKTCATCYGSQANECESCNGTSYLNTNSHNCVQICPNGQYAQKSPQQICKLCNAVCNTCSGPSDQDCAGCPDNRFLWNKQCLSNCPVGYFRENNPNRCTTCHQTCARCDNSPLQTKCTSCYSGRYFYNSQCLLQCPDGFYGDKVLNLCGVCYKTCKTCFEIEYNNCLTCYPGTYLIKNTCVASCPEHYVPDNSTGTCVECPKECQTCEVNNPTLCTQCQTGWYLLDKKCLQRCPKKYYTDYNTQTCKSCTENCDECTGPTIQQCLTWHKQDIPWTNLLIFWIFIGKSAYCAFAFLLGYYLDHKYKPLKERKPFKDPREVIKYQSVAPAPQVGASGADVINRRGRNGTVLLPNDGHSIFPQSLANIGVEDLEQNSPVKQNTQHEVLDDQFQLQNPNNSKLNKRQKNPKGLKKKSNQVNNDSDDEDDDEQSDGDNEGDRNQDTNQNGDEDDEDDDTDDKVQGRNDITDKPTANGENGSGPKPEKKGIKFLRKAILRHGTLMKLKGDIRQKSDKEIMDLIIPQGGQDEKTKKKVGGDEMVVESIEVGADNYEGNTPNMIQRKNTRQGTGQFDTPIKNKDNKKLKKQKKPKKIGNIGAKNEDDDEEEEDDFGNPLNHSMASKKSVPNRGDNSEVKSQSTVFNPYDNNNLLKNNTQSQLRPITPQTTINQGNKPYLPNNVTMGTFNQTERSNKVNPKFPNGIGYFRTLLEFYELTTIFIHYDYEIERPLRALMFFSKLMFIFCLTRPYDTEVPIFGIIFCMFGLKILMNCLERLMTKLGKAFDKLLFIFFAAAVIYILFNTLFLFMPTLDWVTFTQDFNWSLKYLITFGADLIVFQVGYFTIQYFVTKEITFCSNLSFSLKIIGYLFFKENISDFISQNSIFITLIQIFFQFSSSKFKQQKCMKLFIQKLLQLKILDNEYQ